MVSSTTDHPVPTDQDKQPIAWDGNPAYVDGILDECEKYYQRAGLFQNLLRTGAVALPNGKIAVDSVNAIPFHQDLVDVTTYSFKQPCPPTALRVDKYNKSKPVTSPEHKTPTADQLKTLKESGPGEFIVAAFTVQEEDRRHSNRKDTRSPTHTLATTCTTLHSHTVLG